MSRYGHSFLIFCNGSTACSSHINLTGSPPWGPEDAEDDEEMPFRIEVPRLIPIEKDTVGTIRKKKSKKTLKHCILKCHVNKTE